MRGALFNGKASREEGDEYGEWAIAVAEHVAKAGAAGSIDLDGM